MSLLLTVCMILGALIALGIYALVIIVGPRADGNNERSDEHEEN